MPMAVLNLPDFYEAVITSTDVFAVERTLSHIHERSVSSHVGVFPEWIWVSCLPSPEAVST